MTSSDTRVLARQIAEVAIEKNAADVCLIDLRGVVSYTDFFVIASASNTRLTKAVSDHVVERMRELGYERPRRRETDVDGSWLLLDYVDVVVHIFTPEAREFYRLETLWGQVPQERVDDSPNGAVASDAQSTVESARDAASQ